MPCSRVGWPFTEGLSLQRGVHPAEASSNARTVPGRAPGGESPVYNECFFISTSEDAAHPHA